MHLRNVEIFCDVAQRRSFSKGAAVNRVSQSAASQAVLALEKRLGTQLIDRSQRPLELTPAGQVYYAGCRELLEHYRSLEDRVRRMQDMVVGTVRVAAIYSVGLMQMEWYVEQFETLYPDAHLRIDYAHPDEVYGRLLRDEADLGLVSFPRHGEFVSLDWQNQPMVLVVPPGHRLAGRDTAELREIADEDFVAFTDDLTIRREVDRWLKQAKVSVNVVHAFDNIESIKSAIEDGSGVALLPEPTVSREVSARTLAALPLSGVQFFRPVGIVHRRNKHLTTPALKLIDLLREGAPVEKAAGGTPAAGVPEAGRSPNGSKPAKSAARTKRA